MHPLNTPWQHADGAIGPAGDPDLATVSLPGDIANGRYYQ
jgi:hypothetical protein